MFEDSILINNILSVMLEALPFLAFGFFVAGLLKAFVPDSLVTQYLGKENIFSPIKASLLGMPIPLCSCSVIPVASGLRRGGAGKGSLTAFLISAPETGVDSLSLSYAMLGPVMLVARIVSALCTAIFTAWAVMGFTKNIPMRPLKAEVVSCSDSKKSSTAMHDTRVFNRFITGQRYSFTTLLDDSFKWVLVALASTIILKTYVPAGFFNDYGDGIISMLIMGVISFPLYICASASTPVAAGLLLVGVSPGSVLVFMLAGPASNLATVGVVNKLLNKRSAIIYVIGVFACSILAGLSLNFIIDMYSLDIFSEVKHESILHSGIAIPATIFVLLASIKPLRPYLGLIAKK